MFDSLYEHHRRNIHEADAYGYSYVVTENDLEYVDEAFAYTGRLLDQATGLQNNLNRWYDASAGRWLSEDPIGFAAGDANLYRYVGNGPVNGRDPSGLWEWDDDWIQQGIGGLIGFYGWDVASEGWSEIDEGAAATADGIIPLFDPFEDYYADENGCVDDIYQWSRLIAAGSRDIALIAAGQAFAGAIAGPELWAEATLVDKFLFTHLWPSFLVGAQESQLMSAAYTIAQLGWSAGNALGYYDTYQTVSDLIRDNTCR